MLAQICGVLGLVTTLGGLAFSESATRRKQAFLLGACLLLGSSILAQHTFFICFEAIVLLGCVLAFVDGHRIAKCVALLLAGFAAAMISASANESWRELGAAGLLVMACGYATNAALWYALGSAVVGLRAWLEFAAEPAWLPAVFGILNTIFVAVCAIQMIRAARRY